MITAIIWGFGLVIGGFLGLYVLLALLADRKVAPSTPEDDYAKRVAHDAARRQAHGDSTL